MLLAVAGLNKDEVEERTEKMASGDWSGFSLAEQAAFAFARKQARAPAGIADADIRELEKYFGKRGAWSVVWWSSRCHYMTSVADAFQLPLEPENVFLERSREKR